jgi:protein-S-isoprenylcysteine O-methyltransferase Ste14
MSALQVAVPVLWLVFLLYWMVSALGAKRGSRSGRRRPPGVIIVLIAFVLLRVVKTGSLSVHDPVLQVAGLILFASGLALAVLARVRLGRNWGMPMTRKDEPELVTAGPYRYVRHPIYTGILLAMLGTSLATTLYWLIAFAVMGAYFVRSARVEERLMTESFPTTYPSYRAHTKMLLPFVF